MTQLNLLERTVLETGDNILLHRTSGQNACVDAPKILLHTAELQEKDSTLPLLAAARQKDLCAFAATHCFRARSMLGKVSLDKSIASCGVTGQQRTEAF